jgi:hypothetical protein
VASAVGVKNTSVTNRHQLVRQSRKPLIVGKGNATTDCTGSNGGPNIVAARQLKAVYRIDNVDCAVDEIELKEFVSRLGVRVISSFKVKPRLSDYQRRHNYLHNTFRLCINRADSELLLQADKWPSDILISRWSFSGKSDIENNNNVVEISQANQTSLGNIIDSNHNLQNTETHEIDMDETVLVYDSGNNSPTAAAAAGAEHNATNENG